MDLLKKYISGNSLEWLLDPSDPDVRYLALRDVLDQAGGDDYRSAESFVLASNHLKQGKEGVPGNTGRYDLYTSGTMWAFAEMIARGLDSRSGIVRDTASFLIGAGIGDNGGFSLPWKPRAESALYTGELLRLLLSAGVMDEYIPRGIEWILGRQRHDGGWLHWPVGGWSDLTLFLLFNRPGQGFRRENDDSVASCPYATIACAMALALYNRKHPSEKVARGITCAADFFLRSRVYEFCSSLFNSRLIYRQDFTLPGYPVLGQYDALYGLVFLAGTGGFDDPRASAAFNGVMSRQNGDGTWNGDSRYPGMIAPDKSRKWHGRRSKWVTLNVFRLLKRASEGSRNTTPS